MNFIRIRSGGPRCEDRPFTAQEALVLWVVLRKGRTRICDLIKGYGFHPQEACRVLQRLTKRGLISSESYREERIFKLTDKGKNDAQKVAGYQPILSTYFKPLTAPSEGKIVNVGGGTCEIARLIGNRFYHMHLSLLASMAIPPGEQLYAKTIKGTPFIIFGNEEERE